MILTTLIEAAIVDVLVQGLFGSLALSLNTEKFYDLVGCGTFVLLAWLTCPNHPDSRQRALTNIVMAARTYLAIFLFQRVMRRGGDRRFDEAKRKKSLFATYWVGQAVWAFVTSLPLLIVNGTKHREPLSASNIGDVLGASMVALGLGFQITADLQKHRFQQNPANANKFIDTGLWRYSRHPNYFGEILSWMGVYFMALPVMHGLWMFIGALSPIFSAFLLLFVSGVPMLEKHAERKWGQDPKYQAYKENTPMIIPMLNLL